MPELIRATHRVTNLIGSLGRISEPTLTAFAGFLIARFPIEIGSLFLPDAKDIKSVSIEESGEKFERYDIVVESLSAIVLVEGKLAFEQQEKQVLKYLATKKKVVKGKKLCFVALDRGSFRTQTWLKDVARHSGVSCWGVTWTQFHERLSAVKRRSSLREKDPVGWAVASELIEFMEEQQMVRKNTKEVYVRDMSGESIELFFKHHIYRWQPQYLRSADGNAYFAPYFTGKAPSYFERESLIRVERGISWMAPIRDLAIIKKKEVESYLRSNGHSSYREAAKQIRSESRQNEILVLLLGDPFLVFLTPVSKKKLAIRGTMGSRSFSFEDLFRAAGKGD